MAPAAMPQQRVQGATLGGQEGEGTVGPGWLPAPWMPRPNHRGVQGWGNLGAE